MTCVYFEGRTVSLGRRPSPPLRATVVAVASSGARGGDWMAAEAEFQFVTWERHRNVKYPLCQTEVRRPTVPLLSDW